MRSTEQNSGKLLWALAQTPEKRKLYLLWHHFWLPEIVKQGLLNIYLSIFVFTEHSS